MSLSAYSAPDAYPLKPITMVIPFPPGGPTDVTGRILAEKLGGFLNQTIVVENRPGASANIGAQHVARAKPDGYTLLMAHTGEFSVNPAIFPNIPYSLEKDFLPITMISDTPMLLVAKIFTAALRAQLNWSLSLICTHSFSPEIIWFA